MKTKIYVKKKDLAQPIFDSGNLAIQADVAGRIVKTFPGGPEGDPVHSQTVITHKLGFKPIVYAYFAGPDGKAVKGGFYFYECGIRPGYCYTRTSVIPTETNITFDVMSFNQMYPVPASQSFQYTLYYFIVARKIDYFNTLAEDKSVYYDR